MLFLLEVFCVGALFNLWIVVMGKRVPPALQALSFETIYSFS
jgi:hypothetical protein